MAGRGRPRHQPTPETRKIAESLAGYGVPHEQIGHLIGDGITHDTLVKYYSEDLERGKAKANAKIGQSLFQKATSGDTTALIWWTKSQMRWKGTDVVETPDLAVRDPSGMTDDEILAEIRARRSARKGT